MLQVLSSTHIGQCCAQGRAQTDMALNAYSLCAPVVLQVLLDTGARQGYKLCSSDIELNSK